MATIRDRIVAAAITTLNTGTPVGVPQAERVRTADIGLEELPSIIVFPTLDVPEPVGSPGIPIVRSRLSLTVELRAAGTALVRPDQALDPLYSWVIRALVRRRLSDGAGGFLNHDTLEGQTTFAYEQGDKPLAFASVELVVSYQHLSNDPDNRT